MFRKRHTAEGARPGTLVIPPDAPKPSIRLIRYDADGVEEREVSDRQVLRSLSEDSVHWVDVQGLGDEACLRELADIFHVHPLALEDVVNVPQRPKAEQYDDHLFIVTRMIRLNDELQVDAEQVGIFIGHNLVLTFQERPGDVLDPIRDRIRQGKGPIRKAGADYLAYAILDRIIDAFYPVLEDYGEALEDLEEEIFYDPRPELLEDIFEARRELLAIRRAVWPQRDALNVMIRESSPHLSDDVRTYLRDCHDHAVQAIDVIESYRELAGSLMDFYMSNIGNRQNEVMKVLTIMASIFIPLTFLAGIYGMNFEHMPELSAPWMYPMLLATMGLIAAVMIAYFRARGWIGRRGRKK